MSKSTLNEIKDLKLKIQQNLKEILELKRKNMDFKPKVKEIWELSKKKFVLETKANKTLKKYEGIIFTVGTTPQPIILNILANKPEAVYFIYTDRSEEYLDIIYNEANLNFSQIDKGKMPKNSILALFRLVKQGLRFLNEEKHIEKQNIAIDPTGGTKVMSVACGLTTSLLDLDILYVDNDNYNEELRRPEPGSERLVNFPKPKEKLLDYKLLNDMEISKNKISQIAQYFEDITTTHIVYLMLKTGIELSSINYLRNHSLNGDLFSGFISAMSSFEEEICDGLGIDSEDINKDGRELTLNYKDFKVNVINGKFTRVVSITDKAIGKIMKDKLYQLIDEYENIHYEELSSSKVEMSMYQDFPKITKDTLDLGLNEPSQLNSEKLYQYKKNPTILYVLNNWYQRMMITTTLDSFYPSRIPTILRRKLGMDKEEARYWTYDLFKAEMIIPE